MFDNTVNLTDHIERGTFVTVYYDGTRLEPDSPDLDNTDNIAYWHEINMPEIGHVSGMVAAVYDNTFYLALPNHTPDTWDVQIDAWEIVDIV